MAFYGFEDKITIYDFKCQLEDYKDFKGELNVFAKMNKEPILYLRGSTRNSFSSDYKVRKKDLEIFQRRLDRFIRNLIINSKSFHDTIICNIDVPLTTRALHPLFIKYSIYVQPTKISNLSYYTKLSNKLYKRINKEVERLLNKDK